MFFFALQKKFGVYCQYLGTGFDRNAMSEILFRNFVNGIGCQLLGEVVGNRRFFGMASDLEKAKRYTVCLPLPQRQFCFPVAGAFGNNPDSDALRVQVLER